MKKKIKEQIQAVFLDIDGTYYDDININSIKNQVNDGDGISGITVRFDDDGIATTVKD